MEHRAYQVGLERRASLVTQAHQDTRVQVALLVGQEHQV